VLPNTAVAAIDHMSAVQEAAAVYQIPSLTIRRTPYVPAAQTGGIGIDAASTGLLAAVGGTLQDGQFVNAANDRYPTVVLGARAASTLQIHSVTGHIEVFLGDTWFNVIGIMRPVVLDPTLDNTVLIGLPVAERVFQLPPNPSEIYVRANINHVTQVSNLLAATADPQNANGVQVSRPSDVLQARAAARGQFTTLLLGLGAVALLVGAIGIANIMVISVLERRGEIGLRRALGATRKHISSQFLAESAILAALGGLAGLALGALATLSYSQAQNQPMVIPVYALLAAPLAGLLIGTLAGLYPAAKAASLSPTEALRAT
jgi:putative ABC transport system permease protein